MSKKLLVGVAAAIVVVGGLVAAWYLFIRDDAPERVSLEAAIAETQDTTDPTAESQPPATGSTVQATSGAGVDGTWIIDAAASSFVGYRVEEEVARIGAQTAVGRTGDVTGSLELEGTMALSVTMEADLSTIDSGSDNRDRQMRRQALETGEFPLATFVLTAPIDFGAIPADGVPLTAEASGDLTIHGVTQAVVIPIEAQLAGDQIVVVGAIPVVFADYGIDTPTSFNLLSIESVGEMEFQLFFTR